MSFRFSWRAYRAMTVSFFKSQVRNPIALLFGPILVVLLFGFFKVSLLQRNATMVLVNQSSSPAAAQLATALEHTPHLTVTTTKSEDAARSDVKGGTEAVMLVIPEGFGTKGGDGRLARSGAVVIYGTDQGAPQVLAEIAQYVDQIDRQQQATPQVLTVNPHFIASGNPILAYLLPGVLALNVMVTSITQVVSIFSGYRKEGVLKRVRATGTPASSFVLAHATGVTLITGINVVLTVVMATTVSGGVDLPAMFGLAMLAYLSSLGIGLIIGGAIRDPDRAERLGGTIGMPMYMIAFIPSGVLPVAVTAVVNVIPVGFMIHGVRQVFAGNDLWSVRGDILGLALWAVVALSAAAVSFRWEEQPD